ncbi:MAG: MaoC family dehydratase [Halobacteriales archaeon]
MTDLPQTFEDVTVGDRFESDDRYEVTREEILEFAEKYDPQPFHLDEDAAAESHFGGLIASGWHTAAMAMRLLVDGLLVEDGSAGAIGADDLRWYEPVRPGNVLRLEGEVEDKGPWSDAHGLVHSRVELFNDDDGLVMSYVGLVLWERGGSTE